MARGRSGHGLGGLVPRQYRLGGVVWAAQCHDGVLNCCWLWLFYAYPSFLLNGAIINGDTPPDCSGQGEGQILMASSRASHAVAAAPSFQACLRACICTCCMCVCK